MTWISFISLLLGFYILYYGVNFLVDYLRSPAEKTPGDNQSLRLVEDIEPEIITEADVGPDALDPDPASVPESEAPAEAAQEQVRPQQQEASGGVSISELVRLCRQQAIVQSARHKFATT